MLKYQKHVNVTAILCFVKTWVVYEQEMAFMECSNTPPPPPPDERWGGGQFYWGFGDLNFHLPLGGHSQMGGLKFFTLFWGRQQGFLYWGDGGGVSPQAHWPKITQVSLVDSPYQIFILPFKGSSLPPNPLNDNFQVIIQ